MPPRPGRVGRRGVIGNPVARTAAVVGTAAGARCQPAPRPARRPPRRQTGPPRRPPRPSILTPRATDPHPTDARIGVRRQGPRDRSACGGLTVAYLGGQRGLLRWRRGGCRRNVAEHADEEASDDRDASDPRRAASPRQGGPHTGTAGCAPRVRTVAGPGSGGVAAGSGRSRGCPSWCRSGTAGCWSRRSPSTGGRRCRWPPTWPRHPTSGLRVQLCGDAHLSNFGAFASPERRLVFDVNDFDETLPGPFEWDVKRLAASLAVAGRDNGFSAKETGARSSWPASQATAPRCASSPTCRCSTSGTPTSTSRTPCAELRPSWPRRHVKTDREGARQGPHPRQHAGAEQADHRGRRAAPDHQRPAADRAGRGAVHRPAGRRDLRAAQRGCWRATGAPCSPTVATCWSSST